MVRTLLVDDSLVICKSLTTLLSDVPHVEVIGQATSGSEAVEIITKLIPDVILLDINIPGSNGFTILTWVRESYGNIKVIMLSNYSQKEYRDMSFGLGAHYFLDKASEFEKLPQILFEINAEINLS